jgi:hypothetical protein
VLGTGGKTCVTVRCPRGLGRGALVVLVVDALESYGSLIGAY